MLNVKPTADSLFLLFNPHFITAFIHQSALKTETDWDWFQTWSLLLQLFKPTT